MILKAKGSEIYFLDTCTAKPSGVNRLHSVCAFDLQTLHLHGFANFIFAVVWKSTLQGQLGSLTVDVYPSWEGHCFLFFVLTPAFATWHSITKLRMRWQMGGRLSRAARLNKCGLALMMKSKYADAQERFTRAFHLTSGVDSDTFPNETLRYGLPLQMHSAIAVRWQEARNL